MNRAFLFLGLIVSLLGASAGFGKGKLQVVATLPELGGI